MAKIVEFRRKPRRHSAGNQPALAVDIALCQDIHLRNLIDSWIVPKLVDDWMDQTAGTDPPENDDNGEHL